MEPFTLLYRITNYVLEMSHRNESLLSLPQLCGVACTDRGRHSVREAADQAPSKPDLDLSWVEMSSDPTEEADCPQWVTCDTVVPLVCDPALQSSRLPPSVAVPQPTEPLRG